jgi:hypothetical protein
MMSADMEISRYLVDKNKSTQLAPFIIFQSFHGISCDFLGHGASFIGIPPLWLHLSNGVNFGMSTFINVGNNSNFLASAVKPVLCKFAFDINTMNPSDIDNI